MSFYVLLNEKLKYFKHVHTFINSDNNEVGSIKSSGSATAFNTSSDYRLKVNITYDWDATTRLKQLKPARFNFKEEFDSDKTTVDGFIAHEVSSIVPESIVGTKDATKTITNVVKNASGDVIGENIPEADWTAGKAADPQLYPSNSTSWLNKKNGIVKNNIINFIIKYTIYKFNDQYINQDLKQNNINSMELELFVSMNTNGENALAAINRLIFEMIDNYFLKELIMNLREY